MSQANTIPIAQLTPLYARRFQAGITDPIRPVETPAGVSDEAYARYRGRVELQGFLTIIRANVLARDRAELQIALQKLSQMAYHEMERSPDQSHTLPLDARNLPDSYRVTVTIGFGATLFRDRTGRDRYGLRGRMPRSLKIMPSLPQDQFLPGDTATDIILLVCSDHQYVNVWITKRMTDANDLGQYFDVTGVERGFARPDLREHLGFDDGIANLRATGDDPLHRLVYVDQQAHEPAWCEGGTYLVYRKIREQIGEWERIAEAEQERRIGRSKRDGNPLTHNFNRETLIPDYAGDEDGQLTPLMSHIRKVQPRRPAPDLFGVNDLDRRFHRRAYPFFDGVQNDQLQVGLHFLAFMRSIREQFEHVATMWQFNPNFPRRGTGIDAMYAEYDGKPPTLSTLDGGYYFCPPGITEKDDFVGSGLFGPRGQSLRRSVHMTTTKSPVSFYLFDFDDNIMYLKTKIVVINTITGEEVELSTEDYAAVHPQLGKPGKWGDYAEFEGTFRNFRDADAAPDEQPFVKDVLAAVQQSEDKWKAPSWDLLVYACQKQRPVSIITARGHSAATIQAGIRALVNSKLLPAEPVYHSIYPVTNEATRKQLSENTAPNTEALTMPALTIPALKRLAIIESVDRAVRDYGPELPHRFGMSDDDPANISLIVSAMRDCKEKHQDKRFFVINSQREQKVKLEVFTIDTAVVGNPHATEDLLH
ncbi:Dyp-type peroxidase [Anatilimnocola floriformis]|uniref:Dyp-type peroxidase n=1 Tax=Anatilimnocola floriformis TaxID=2948575 RepID=UPI0020C28294|nr:Dyp-type peroxidase [Anatilimnocola floriformis]